MCTSDPANRRDSFGILSIGATTSFVAFGHFGQCPLMTGKKARSALTVSAICDQFTFARRREHVHAPIHSDRLSCNRKRALLTLRLEEGIPPFVSPHDERTPKLRNRPPLTKPYRAHARNIHATLLLVELQRSISMRKRDLVPTRRRFETRIAGRFSVRNSSEERVHR